MRHESLAPGLIRVVGLMTAMLLALTGTVAAPAAANPAVVLVDDCRRWGPPQYWYERRNNPNGHDNDFVVTGSTGDGSRADNGCDWTASAPGGSGPVRVDAYIPKADSVALTKYYVRHAGGTAVVQVNQRVSYGWVTLGTFDMPGPTVAVSVNDATGRRGELIGFDAIRWVRQQTQPSTPVAATREQRAAQWARERVGERHTNATGNGRWSGWCEVFAEQAFATRYRFGSAMDHYRWQASQGRIRTGVPPLGAVVFYDTAHQYGHVGISVGGGRVVSTWGFYGESQPVREHGLHDLPRYLGWALAPPSWPSR